MVLVMMMMMMMLMMMMMVKWSEDRAKLKELGKLKIQLQ